MTILEKAKEKYAVNPIVKCLFNNEVAQIDSATIEENEDTGSIWADKVEGPGCQQLFSCYNNEEYWATSWVKSTEPEPNESPKKDARAEDEQDDHLISDLESANYELLSIVKSIADPVIQLKLTRSYMRVFDAQKALNESMIDLLDDLLIPNRK